MEEKVKILWKKLPLKAKLIIIAIAAAFIMTVIFIVIMIAPLINLGIIDINGLGGDMGLSSSSIYSDVNSSSGYWWPIGGSEVTISNGKEYANGAPACTYISSYFGYRKLDGVDDYHSGMDISCAPSNVYNVIAVEDGIVESVVNSYSDVRNKAAGYGNYVKIKHNNGDLTIYAHMYLDSIKVNIGDYVKKGQVLGKMGSSGNSTGTHLHFEIRANGTSAVDPANYISSDNPRPKKSSVNYIDGNSTKQTVCLSLKANGFSTNGTIALMTNINHESSFNPNEFGDGGTSYGLCQWHNERYINLQNTFPNNYQTVEGQIQYLIYELKNEYPGLYNNLLNNNPEASDLAYQFCKEFERPDDTEKTCKTRGNNVGNFTNYVTNNCK